MYILLVDKGDVIAYIKWVDKCDASADIKLVVIQLADNSDASVYM